MLEFVVLSLAVYRLTRLLTVDVIFERFREWVWRRFPPERGGVGYLLTCSWCSSMWVASLIVVCYTIVPVATFTVAFVPALSAVAGFLASKLDS